MIFDAKFLKSPWNQGLFKYAKNLVKAIKPVVILS